MSAKTKEQRWTQVEEEALQRFSEILRLDTSNPPGDERVAVDYLAAILDEAAISYELVEPRPGRASLVARLAGTGTAGGPLLLSSHLDVVPADEAEWKHPPFSGEIFDGFLWGRGAIDMKHMTIYALTTLLEIKKTGRKPERDLIFAAVADEEAGSDWGMRWLVEERPDLVRAEYALNEVGGFTLHAGKKRLYPIQVAEKGFVWMRLSARGTPGHGSMPHGDNPVATLARAIDKIDRTRLPVRLTEVVGNFLREIGEAMGGVAKIALAGARFPPMADFVIDHLPDAEKKKVFGACLHNTVCPTALEGGGRVNVIGGKASVLLDGRTIPGASEEDLLQELRRVIGPDLEIEVLKSGPPMVVEHDTDLYRTIRGVVERMDPGSRVVPYMVAGFTDSKWLAQIGVKAYGFAPIRWPADVSFSELFHGRDERIPVDGFRWGLRCFHEVVAQTLGIPL